LAVIIVDRVFDKVIVLQHASQIFKILSFTIL